MLRGEGESVNRKRVQRLMRLMGIAALEPKPRTSKPAPGHKRSPPTEKPPQTLPVRGSTSPRQARRRCWEQAWVVEFDIRGLFDNLDHGLLTTALRKHCQDPWILLYVERWLSADQRIHPPWSRRRECRR